MGPQGSLHGQTPLRGHGRSATDVATFVTQRSLSLRVTKWTLGSLGSFLLQTSFLSQCPWPPWRGLETVCSTCLLSGAQTVWPSAPPPRPATQRHLPQDPISEKSLSSGVKYLFLLVLFLITELVVFCGQEAIEDDCFLHWAASRRLLAKSLDPQGFVANPADASLLRDPWFYQICSFSWSMPF